MRCTITTTINSTLFIITTQLTLEGRLHRTARLRPTVDPRPSAHYPDPHHLTHMHNAVCISVIDESLALQPCTHANPRDGVSSPTLMHLMYGARAHTTTDDERTKRHMFSTDHLDS